VLGMKESAPEIGSARVGLGGGRLAQVNENDKAVLIYSTFPSPETAERAGGMLVDRGLAACVNIVPGMLSIYMWQGQRCRDSETIMIVKTRLKLADAVVAEVRRVHPYTNPALVVLPVSGGSPDFLRWIAGQTATPQ
jgi:periplasmic divalent cation tolerance protein